MSDEEYELDQKIRPWPRTPETDPYQAGLEKLATHLKHLIGKIQFSTAYNEFCTPTLEEAVEKQIAEGATDITVVSTMFTPGGSHSEYEIPEEMAANGEDGGLVNMVRGYFIFAVFTGGILGLSLANAVFVDEMIADNNDRLEKMVTNLREELADKREQDETAHVERWKSVETQLRHIQEQLTKMGGG